MKKIDSLRFYKSILDDVSKIGMKGCFGKFPEAYTIVNSLMFEGTESEKNRIAEGKLLSPELFNDIGIIREVYRDIFLLMKENTSKRMQGSFRTYRTEREQGIEDMKRFRRTVSFTSTSKNPDFSKYLQNKIRLVILEYIIPYDTPYVDVNAVLGDNIYVSEAEILLPPFLDVDIREVELSEKEKCYKDANGETPVRKYIITVKGVSEVNDLENISEDDEYVSNEEEIKNAIYVVNEFKEKKEISQECLDKYVNWKKFFQKLVYSDFCNILKEKNLLRKPTETNNNE